MKYTVEKGDTLYGISNQFGVSVTDLKKINNLSSNTINIGQILNIPINSGTNPDNLFNYIVKKGDTLYGIANRYGISVSEIISLNNLSNNNLSIGMVLLIPENYSNNITMPDYTIYEVKKGDTLYSIALKNNTTVDKLIKDNNLPNNNLNIGQILKIESMVEDECYGSDLKEDIVYTVKKGDSLYSIAKKYNVSVSDIKNKNKITSNLLSIGQKLKI